MFLRNSEKLESLVGSKSHFNGSIKTEGTLRIDGTVDGNVEADWVVLGEKATLRGDVTARGVIAGGRIEGHITAGEILEIKAKGQVIGDVTAPRLAISEGGILDGRSNMQKKDSKIIGFPLRDGTTEI